MSGHSKWAGIKHQKAANDAKRGNVFTRLGNAITVAAKQGGGDPTMNPSLRLAIEKARAANMPKDNVERAVNRGTGELGGAAVEELLYEGFGPANTAILVEVLTDNRNRSNADIRTIFSKNGGRMAESGVAYQFTQRGVLRFEDIASNRVESFEELVIDSGAEDYVLQEGYATVFVEVPDLHKTKDVLEAGGFVASSVKIERVANTPTEISDEELEKLVKLIDVLEENDDVTSVYTNVAE